MRCTRLARTTSLLPVTVAAAAAVALVTVPPACAEGMSRTDGRADMWSIPADRPAEPRPAPGQTNGDIRSVSVRHGTHAVVVQASFTELRRGRFDLNALSGGVETDEGVFRGFSVGWDDHSGSYAWVEDAAQRRVRCAWTHRLSFEANTVVVRIPRSCLSRPRWVRVTLRTYRTEDAIRNTTRWSDDALSGRSAEGKALWTRRLHRA